MSAAEGTGWVSCAGSGMGSPQNKAAISSQQDFWRVFIADPP